MWQVRRKGCGREGEDGVAGKQVWYRGRRGCGREGGEGVAEREAGVAGRQERVWIPFTSFLINSPAGQIHKTLAHRLLKLTLPYKLLYSWILI